MRFEFGLNGRFGAFRDGVVVKVSGFSDNFVVRESFPLLVADNSYTFVYLLQNLSHHNLCLFVPETFLNLVEYTGDIPSNTTVDIDKFQLDGSFSSFKDGQYVTMKGGSRVYKVKSSFLMINSASSSIICYKLLGVDGDDVFFCPYSFLVRVFQPDTVKVDNGEGNPSV